MSLLSDVDPLHLFARLDLMLKNLESPLRADLRDVATRLVRLRHCIQCGSYSEHEGDTCDPCLDLESRADDEGGYVRRVQ